MVTSAWTTPSSGGWLPGLLPYGTEVTVSQLLSDTSGLIDDNDVASSPEALQQALANVRDKK